jgi:hypothetical protein
MNNETTYFKGGQKFNSDGSLCLTFRATPSKFNGTGKTSTNGAKIVSIQAQRDRLEYQFQQAIESDKRESKGQRNQNRYRARE